MRWIARQKAPPKPLKEWRKEFAYIPTLTEEGVWVWWEPIEVFEEVFWGPGDPVRSFRYRLPLEQDHTNGP